MKLLPEASRTTSIVWLYSGLPYTVVIIAARLDLCYKPLVNLSEQFIRDFLAD